MKWLRGETIGYGSFATVSLASPVESYAHVPALMAVKSSDFLNSASLMNEKRVLDNLGDCPQIVRCFGDDCTVEDGKKVYNLFLEYASRGDLASEIKKSGGGLPETVVRRCLRSILKGLRYIHSKGFAHCDVKLQNMLVFDSGDVKISDFGMATRTPDKQRHGGRGETEIRGTPLYMSPESVNGNEYDSPGDIWALGCAVVEMMTGKPAWNCQKGCNIPALLLRIGAGDELPTIPEESSEEVKDFLGKCLVKDPRLRWTAEMLLDHSFLAVDIDQENIVIENKATIPLCCNEVSVTPSPKSPFDFAKWVSGKSRVKKSVSSTTTSSKYKKTSFDLMLSSPKDRIKRLIGIQNLDWSTSKEWISVLED